MHTSEIRSPQPHHLEAKTTREVNWLSVFFIVGIPVLLVPAIWFQIQYEGFSWVDVGIFLALWYISGIAITAGYHRYYAHKTHQAARWVQMLYILFGTMTVQNAAIVWASDHRYHHQFEDRDGDPYNINKGFVWAHVGWMLWKTQSNRPFSNAPDLRKDKLVMWQYRNYFWLVGVMAFLLPTLIGACFGRPLGGLLWGGFLRMVVFHHTTFFVNSLAHVWGRKNFSEKNTARDQPVTALLTFGEGYHSFHHAYPSDHRIGHRWFHYDPGKWWIRGLSRIGATWDLKKHPNVHRVGEAQVSEPALAG